MSAAVSASSLWLLRIASWWGASTNIFEPKRAISFGNFTTNQDLIFIERLCFPWACRWINGSLNNPEGFGTCLDVLDVPLSLGITIRTTGVVYVQDANARPSLHFLQVILPHSQIDVICRWRDRAP